MAVTDPDAEPHKRMSMFIVPADAEGLSIERNFRFYGEREDVHGYMHWRNVRVPKENILGGRGDAFVVSQVRLNGGRMHHAMRTLVRLLNVSI